METRIIEWTDLKIEITNRNLLLQGEDENGSYYIRAKDDFILFKCEIEQTDPANSDQVDFETNYKPTWNAILEHRNNEGLHRIIGSPRPDGTKTYFTGSGDNGGLGSGNRFMIKMKATDTTPKHIDITMNENIFAYRGSVQFEGAPFGSYVEFSVVVGEVEVAKYVTKVPMLGDNYIIFQSQDVEMIPLGAKIRFRVTNADGGLINGETGYNYDAAAEFKVAAFIETYRPTLL
jgi:hypothetical protein